MLPTHVALCELTGKPLMSALRMLSVGKREHVVPGSGCAATGVPARGRVPTTIKAASRRPTTDLKLFRLTGPEAQAWPVRQLGRWRRAHGQPLAAPLMWRVGSTPSSFISFSNISWTSASKLVLGAHPRFFDAFDASPRSSVTSAGRTYAGSV